MFFYIKLVWPCVLCMPLTGTVNTLICIRCTSDLDINSCFICACDMYINYLSPDKSIYYLRMYTVIYYLIYCLTLSLSWLLLSIRRRVRHAMLNKNLKIRDNFSLTFDALNNFISGVRPRAGRLWSNPKIHLKGMVVKWHNLWLPTRRNFKRCKIYGTPFWLIRPRIKWIWPRPKWISPG